MALSNILSALSAATNAQGNSATIPSPSMATDASLATAQPVSPTPQGASVVNKATKAASPSVGSGPFTPQAPTPYMAPQPWQYPMAPPAPQQQAAPQKKAAATQQQPQPGQGPINEMSPAMALLNFLTHPAVQAHIAAAQGAPQPPTAQSTGINDYSVNPNLNATSSPQVGNPAQNYFQTGQDQDQQPGDDLSQPSLSPIDKMAQAMQKQAMDAFEKYKPTPPAYQQVGPWANQQHFMDLLQQANQMRTQAANQPVPQQQNLSPLMALVAGALATGDRSGKFANNFLQNFNSSAQTANQGALQQYQQTQTAAGIGAQLPEQEAQNLLQQRASQISQNMEQNKNELDRYKAELGYGGKGLQGQDKMIGGFYDANIQSNAKTLAAEINATASNLRSGVANILKTIRDPQTNPALIPGLIQELKQKDPTFDQPAFTDDMIKATANYIAPKALEEKAAADTYEARAGFLFGKTQNLPAEQKRILAQVNDLIASKNLKTEQGDMIAKQVGVFDQNNMVKMAEIAANIALANARVNTGDFKNVGQAVSAYEASTKSLKDQAELAQSQMKDMEKNIRRDSNTGLFDDQFQQARYATLKQIVDDSVTNIGRNATELNAIKTNANATPTLATTPPLNGAVGSSHSYGAGNTQSQQVSQSQGSGVPHFSLPDNTYVVQMGNDDTARAAYQKLVTGLQQPGIDLPMAHKAITNYKTWAAMRGYK